MGSMWHPYRVHHYWMERDPGASPLAEMCHPVGVKKGNRSGTLKGCNPIARGEAPGKQKANMETHPVGVPHRNPWESSLVLGLATPAAESLEESWAWRCAAAAYPYGLAVDQYAYPRAATPQLAEKFWCYAATLFRPAQRLRRAAAAEQAPRGVSLLPNNEHSSRRIEP
jgi:hypothetical protein